MTISVTTIVRDASQFGGGVANVALPLHKVLLQAGVNASLVSSNVPTGQVRRGWVAGARGVPFSALPIEAIGTVVHIHGIWTPFEYFAFQEARRRGTKIVMSPHGALEPWAFQHKWAKKRVAWWLYQKKLLQNADLLVVNSQQEHDSLRNLGLKPPIATIANGVDVEGLLIPQDMTEWREPIVLFFSRLDVKKGLLDLVEAWSRLKDCNNHVLHIQGHGDAVYTQRVIDRVHELGLEGQISVLPPVFGPERWKVFQGASVFVLPTYSENFGITVVEALMAGLPVITTTSTPWGELATSGLGWIVDNDIRQLTDALQAAVKLDSTQLQEIRIKANAYASKRFSWETIGIKYEKTYDWLLQPDTEEPEWITRT